MSKLAEESMRRVPNEVPPIEISPEADAAMRDLVELFSDPVVVSQARLRCSTDGPDEFDVLFESIMEEQFGDSEYREWVKRLYDLGLIARLPDDWR